MSKQNKIIIGLICIFFIVAIIITAVAIYYKTHPVENENIITLDYLESFKDRGSSNEEILTEEFDKYDVISSETRDVYTYTTYAYNDLYDIVTISLGKKIYGIYMVNRVTGTSCDILQEDVQRFIEND